MRLRQIDPQYSLKGSARTPSSLSACFGLAAVLLIASSCSFKNSSYESGSSGSGSSPADSSVLRSTQDLKDLKPEQDVAQNQQPVTESSNAQSVGKSVADPNTAQSQGSATADAGKSAPNTTAPAQITTSAPADTKTSTKVSADKSQDAKAPVQAKVPVQKAAPAEPAAPPVLSSDFSKGLNLGPVVGYAPWSGKMESTTGSAANGPQANLAPVQQAPEIHCFNVIYRHKFSFGHNNEEACSHHKNVIKLKHAKVNPSSICIRVNGRPVKFQTVKGKSDEVIIGPIAGPKSKIMARYCVGKATCNEDCAIPKDEFMDAIGGLDSEEVQTAQLGQWDPSESSAHMDGEIRKELADFDETGKGGGDDSTFRDWISDSDTGIPACEFKQATNSIPGGRS